MASIYVLKGLARQEILNAIDHLHEVARPNLLRMMAWRIGSEHGYDFSLGKNYKLIHRYLPPEDWETLLSTYSGGGYSDMRQALTACLALFRKYAKSVAECLDYPYPAYDEAVTKYSARLYAEWT